MNKVIFWLKGLAAAAIGGTSNAIATALVDPGHFNLSDGLAPLGKLALVGGLVAVMMYLQRSPLPGVTAQPTTVGTNPGHKL